MTPGLRSTPRLPDLLLTDGSYAIARLDPDSPIPPWATDGAFWCLCRTHAELSIVCPQELMPPGVRAEIDWACLEVAGPLDLSQVGILAALTHPLAEAGVGLFALSTFNTDYLFVRQSQLASALAALRRAGWNVRRSQHRPDTAP
ncbi:MAG: ACT domain-containing protein [Chloroflexota bacterium]